MGCTYGNIRIYGDYCVKVNQAIIKIGSYILWIIPYNRLQGVTSNYHFGYLLPPAIFQGHVEIYYEDVTEGVTVYFDDILIAGSTIEEHLQTAG